MENRFLSFINLKKNAYQLASDRGFLKKGIKTYNMALNLRERYITENIIRKTWDFHQDNGVNISDGQETRLIMLNCIYAGMYAEKFPTMDEDVLLETISQPNITQIRNFVENYFSFDGRETFTTCLVAKGLVQDVYNDNIHLYPNYASPNSSAEDHWTYYKDVACVMFELGALYYVNRDE